MAEPNQVRLKACLFIKDNWCKGCGFCVEFCPVHCLVFGQTYNAKGHHVPHLIDPAKCTGCNLCGLMCPEFAIWAERLDHKNT